MIRACLITCLLTCVSVAAQALPNPLADGLRRCASETEEAKRLACFDALAATLPKLEADQFGLTADIAHKRDPVAQHQAAEHRAEAVLPGKIVALRQTPGGELVFTLDNQQVWVQAQAEPSKQFVIGDVVHIEHGAMGSLWLAADKARKTRVKRIS
jgi:hypothetical protein